MGRKKKPFINKNKASTFHLMHRSQRDVGGDILEEDAAVSNEAMVLWPGPNNLPETNQKVLFSSTTKGQEEEGEKSGQGNAEQRHKGMTEWRQKLEAAGLLDTADHEQYLKPITGKGIFLDARSGKTVDLQKHNMDLCQVDDDNRITGEDALLEVNRQLDSIPLTADVMDDDIAAALFGDDLEEGDFEELNDDFVLMAAQEPESDADIDMQAAFDYDEHIQRLVEKAKLERIMNIDGVKASEHDQGAKDLNLFSKLKPLHERKEDDDDDSWDNHDFQYPQDYDEDHMTMTTATPGVVPKLSPDEERALCEKFEATLAEYDSDGNTNDDQEVCYDIHGDRPLEGDSVVEAALDDYLQEKKDDVFFKGTAGSQKRTGGSSFVALVGNKMVSGKDALDNNEAPESIDEILAEAQATLAKPVEKPAPFDDVLIDGKSYFSERERNPYDCESVLSTYSNLDNNPVTIDASSTRRRRKNKKGNKNLLPTNEEEEEEEAQQIHLSAKTGLPIGVFDTNKPSNDNCMDDVGTLAGQSMMSINKGVPRNKKETPEEKKARKLAIKQERTMSRIQKKVAKEVFAEEFQKHAMVSVGADDIAGKTVFRFS